MERTDIQKLRELPIESVAERLGLRVERHKALCPFHDDKHPSLSFSVSKNSFKCFVCDAHGGVIDLAMKVLRKNFVDTCQWLADSSNIILSEYRPPENAINHKPYTFNSERYAKFFDHPFISQAAGEFLFEKRHLDPRVVRWCRLTSWRDRQGIDWLQIPYYDAEWNLTGIQNRNLSGVNPRFMFPRGSRCHIYNLPVVKRLREGEPLYITEGCSDCWSMLSSGHKAIAIPSATTLHSGELKKILKQLTPLGTPLHMYPDRDIPGEKLYLQLTLLATEAGICLYWHSLPEKCKDYSDYYLTLNTKHSS